MVLLCCFNSCKHKQFFFSIIMLKESCWHLLLHFMTEEEKILASHRCHAMHYQTPQDSLSKILSIVEPCLLACCLSGDPAAGGPPRAAARRAGLCVRKSVLRGVVGRFSTTASCSVGSRSKETPSFLTNERVRTRSRKSRSSNGSGTYHFSFLLSSCKRLLLVIQLERQM